MVAGNAECGAVGNHVSNKPNGIEDARAAVHKVADKYHFPPTRVLVNGAAGKSRCAGGAGPDFVSELAQKLLQLIAAAVDIADDVERTVLVALVVIKRNTL